MIKHYKLNNSKESSVKNWRNPVQLDYPSHLDYPSYLDHHSNLYRPNHSNLYHPNHGNLYRPSHLVHIENQSKNQNDVCGFLIFNNDETKILLVSGKKANLFGPPKGHLEKNDESFIDVAIRETREETGINIDKNNKFYTIKSKKTTIFVTKIDENKCDINIEDNTEISYCKWYDITEILCGDFKQYNSTLRFLLKFDYLNKNYF